jgi:hypothetical protein
MAVSGLERKISAMTAAFVLLALSAAIGLALGTSFSWLPILVSSVALAGLSAAVLRIAGFSALSGIAIIVVCLTVNQLAYVLRVTLANRNLKQLHGEFHGAPSDNSQGNIAHKRDRNENAPT